MLGPLSIFVALIYVGIVIRAALKSGERHLAFLLLAIASRYLFSAFPELTHAKLIAGLSVNALATLAIAVVGLGVVAQPYFRLALLLPFYVFVAFVVFAGLLNGEWSGLAESASRLLYLLVLQLAMFGALVRAAQPEKVFSALVVTFLAPVALQWASIVLDQHSLAQVKLEEWQSLEAIGRNYIGTYGHESGFSMILLTMLFVLLFWRPASRAIYWGAVVVCLLGLAYANYRTAIIAASPLVLALAITRCRLAFIADQRGLGTAIVLAVLLVGALAVLGTANVPQRFSGLVALSGIDMFASPDRLTAVERGALSTRVYIWSRYLDAFAHANLAQQLVGFGPESWRNIFPKYAHNTFISYLYEFGILGLAFFVLYLMFNIGYCVRGSSGSVRLALLAGYAGFTLLNLGTMPLWQVEGLIPFALLNGTLLYAVCVRRIDGRAFRAISLPPPQGVRGGAGRHPGCGRHGTRNPVPCMNHVPCSAQQEDRPGGLFVLLQALGRQS